MKIALIGATGFVGSAILKEALDRGHEVTAIVRHPEKLRSHPKLRPRKGDVYNNDEVARWVAGHDAVISAFNPGWSNPDIYNQQIKGTQAIIDGVKKAGAKRLLFVGGAGSLEVEARRPVGRYSRVPERVETGLTRNPGRLESAAQRIGLGMVVFVSFSRSLPGPADRQVPARDGSVAGGCEREKPNLGRGLCDGNDR